MQTREANARQKEYARQDILANLKSEVGLRNAFECESKVDSKRRSIAFKKQIEQQHSILLHEQLEMEKAERRESSRQESEKQKREELEEMERVRTEKYHQSIFENSQDLKQLESKLNEAYINKHRTLQISENILQKKQFQAQKLVDAVEIKKQMDLLADKDLILALKQQRETDQYTQSLTLQLEEKEQQKHQDHILFLHEKQKIDAIVEKILKENNAQIVERFEKRNETQAYIKQFFEEREVYKREDDKRRKVEEEMIQRYVKEQEERVDEEQRKKKEEKAAQGDIYKLITQDMQEEVRKRLELEDLRVELLEAENEEKARQRLKAEMDKRIKTRLELLDAYHDQIKDKRDRIQHQLDTDAEFKQRMLEKYAVEDRVEQMNTQKKRMRMQEHRHIVESMITQRVKDRIDAVRKEKELYEREREVERYRDAVVEQERRRLLITHAKGLGVLRDVGDLELFDEEFRKLFEKKMDVESDDEE